MRAIALAIAAALLPGAAWAHHGWSSYDAAKTVKITAPIDKLEWGNPHSMIWLKQDGVQKEIYLAPISRMMTRGLEPDALKAGKSVTIEAYASTANNNEMRAERITVDGKTFELR